MRTLVTGADGQLGRDLVEELTRAGHEVVGCGRAGLDVSDREAALQVVGRVMPDTVVHAGAWTDVDGCETDPDRAWRVNALGTRHVAEAARRVGAQLCYISTDYVFDGTARRPYTEWDTPNPLSVYGRSKRAGETAAGPDDLVVRTSWVCGRHGRNFVKTILGRAADGKALKVVDDQHGCPTFTKDLAAGLRALIESRRPGLFHMTNQGATTWHDLAREVVSAAGLDVSLVSPVSTADLDPPRAAPRPAYAVLDNAALRLSGLPLLPDHHSSLRELVATLLESGTSR